jgi:hypothetical protein
MKALGSGLLLAALLPGCSGTDTPPSDRPATVPASPGAAASPAAPIAPDAEASGGARALVKAKLTDDDFQAAIAALEAADPAADVEAALARGDHRVYAIQGELLEAPGVTGDWRALPKGAYVVTVPGTNAAAGSKYQLRFQMLARAYAAKYNPLLLSRLK